MPDFEPGSIPDFARGQKAELRSLPYFAYFPLFCIEEENCEGLLWEGKIPDPEVDQLKLLSILWWPKSNPPPVLKP
jgi:hypothetical protein